MSYEPPKVTPVGNLNDLLAECCPGHNAPMPDAEPWTWKRHELRAAGPGIHTIVMQAPKDFEISAIKMAHTAGPWAVHQILLAKRMLLAHSLGIAVFEANGGFPFLIVSAWRLLRAGLAIEFQLENLGDEPGDVTVELC